MLFSGRRAGSAVNVLAEGSLSSISRRSAALSPRRIHGARAVALPFLAAAARRCVTAAKVPGGCAWPCRASYWRAGSWATFLMADYAFGGPLMYPLAEICLVILLFLLTAEREISRVFPSPPAQKRRGCRPLQRP